MPPDARRSLLIYNLFFPFVFLGLLPSFLVRMFRRGGFRERFGQRLGFYTAAERKLFASEQRVWIHSISVGETLAALKLAYEWHEQHPEDRLLLSATTTTGYALAKINAQDWLEPIYNPVDFAPVVRRAFDHLLPRRIVLIEGEAWPNLLAEASRRGVPVVLADARLSPRSEARFRRFAFFTGPIFRLLEQVLVPEPADLGRWESLGVNPQQLHCLGSIKFDQPTAAPAERTDEYRELLTGLGVPRGAPIIVAGSTHAGEERILAEMLPSLREEIPDLFLIVVPRHVERAMALLDELKATGLRVTLRTMLPARADCEMLLVDTTGELREWYGLATVVFVGKSLTALGGQNPVEPALLGLPVIFGPHMENFAGVVEPMVEQGAAVQVADAAQLREELLRLLSDKAARKAMATTARQTLIAHQGATERVVALLAPRAHE